MKKLFLTLLAAVSILPAAADNNTVGQIEPVQISVSVAGVSKACECGCKKADCLCLSNSGDPVMDSAISCCGGECREECMCECTDEICNCDIFELSDEGYDSDSDTDYGDFNRFKKPAKFFDSYGHWAGIALTYSGMVSSLSNLNLPPELSELAQSPRSIGVSINLIDAAMPIFGRNLSLVTGLGLEVNNFRFSRDVGLIKDDSGFTVVDTSFGDAGINLRKSKLTTSYVIVPLLMEVQFHNGIFLNGGVVGAYRLSSHTKIRARDPQLWGTFKDRSNITMPNFRYGYTVTAGIKKVGITATYYPRSIFVKNTGPDTKQVNIGVLFTW